MCQAILDMIEDGKKEGEEVGRNKGWIEGRNEGIKNSCLKMLKKSGSYELVSEVLEIPIDQLKTWEAEDNIHS